MTDHHSAAGPAVTRLTVLHDPGCLLCRNLTAWLRGQPQLVPLEFVAAASAEAQARYPQLDHDASLGEITVVANTGEVWRGPHAFVACLWALAEHRPLAQRLSTPAGLPLARAAAFAASKYRAATGADRGGRAGRAAPGAEGAPGTARPGLPDQPDLAELPAPEYDAGSAGCSDGTCPVPG